MLHWLFIALAIGGELPDCEFPDEPAVYVLTVQPTDDVIRLFGHTALLDYDPEAGPRSPVYDYGLFYLPDSIVDTVWGYLTMQQEYFLGVSDRIRTLTRYRQRGRGVVAQRLELTPEEAERLRANLRQDAEDPTFRYHWYSANCSTKIRDQLDEAVSGGLRGQLGEPSGTSPAREVLRHAADHPLWLGLAWGSTRFARQEIPDWDAMFLPDPMRERLASVGRTDGRRLVAETCRLVPAGQPPIRTEAPSRTGWLALAGFALAGGLVGLVRASRRAGLVAIGVVGSVVALWGTAALVVGLAGTFAPFRGHDNQLYASPLWWLVPAGAIIAGWRPTSPLPQRFGAGLLALAGLGLLGSLVFGFAAGNLGVALAFVALAGAVYGGFTLAQRPSPA